MLKKLLKKFFAVLGIEIHRKANYIHPDTNPYPVELTEDEKKLIDYVIKNNLTLVSRERLFATLLSCKYVLENNLEGDFVECGVWRGGNAILAAGVFKLYNSDKKVYLYDTFQGMTPPTDVDIELFGGRSAKERLKTDSLDKNEEWIKNAWAYASVDDVKNNFSKIGLLSENICFVKGDILQTLDKEIVPHKISVLRLDTDWYESTKKEMNILYEKIVSHGVLMVDDYGHWGGSKKAVDEYFEKTQKRPFLQYIDYAGRLGIKTN